MNNSTLLFVCAAVLTTAFTARVRAGATIGQPTPDFSLNDITGQTYQLSHYRGKTVVLEWVNPECPFVKKHYGSGNIPKLQQAAQAGGVVWLSINTGQPGDQGVFDAAKQAKWAASVSASPTAYLRDPDGKVGKLFGAKTTPHLYVITADGTLVYNGAIDSIRSANVNDIAKAENYVTAALSAVKVASRSQSRRASLMAAR